MRRAGGERKERERDRREREKNVRKVTPLIGRPEREKYTALPFERGERKVPPTTCEVERRLVAMRGYQPLAAGFNVLCFYIVSLLTGLGIRRYSLWMNRDTAVSLWGEGKTSKVKATFHSTASLFISFGSFFFPYRQLSQEEEKCGDQDNNHISLGERDIKNVSFVFNRVHVIVVLIIIINSSS